MSFQESYHGECLSRCLGKVVNGYCNTVGPIKECVGLFHGRLPVRDQCFFSQPFLSESGGNLQIVPEPHVSYNYECVAGTAASGDMRLRFV